jgi:Protein of unknown function (DUF1236)
MKRTILTAVALVAFAAPAFAQSVGVAAGPARGAISFEPQQRTHIHEYVTRERVSPYAARERLAVGARLPADVELRNVPSDWGPHVSKYRYVYSNDRVYFVEPSSREVVYELD